METPYNSVQLFSGGGTRFGYYLGSYAALYERGHRPELILATCGGSLAALLVDLAPEPQQLQALMQSREFYEVIRASQPRRPLTNKAKTLGLSTQYPDYFYNALKRWRLARQPHKLSQRQVKESHDELLAELQHLAMFEMGQNDEWLEALAQLKGSATPTSTVQDKVQNTTDIAMIASRLLPSVARPRQDANAVPLIEPNSVQLQEILFAPNKLTNYPKLSAELTCPTYPYAPHRITREVHTSYDWDIRQAVRASMADMYYLQPTHIDDLGWCLGGVINLTPIELACQLGQTVFAETKSPYDKHLAAPAIQRVFGFDPNERLNQVHSHTHSGVSSRTLDSDSHGHRSKAQTTAQSTGIHWLPFADNGKALAGQHVRKRINLKAGLIDLIHADYANFVKQMQAQWDYGHTRTIAYLKQTKGKL
ncbi:patatin-like phospholipase family protein [Psychrobacter arenosus]|uniref:patatin-like phospholipase family protein n=1 Tax=Psychrobacter arenosus TaxID=256326 RepID=UPI001917D4AE|nr:patatin-like phospholipase family protein [Psychrobacter arenosus]